MTNPPPPPPPPLPPPPPFGGPGAPPPPPPGSGYGAAPVSQPQMQYAGWWRRVGATFVDGIIGWIFLLPGLIAFQAGPTEIDTCGLSDGFGLCEVPTGGTILIGLLLYAGGGIAYLVVYCRMLGRGATWGRKAAGYRVVDERTGLPIGTGRAVGRYFATILSALPCYLGLLWPLWDSENRTFHDMIVRTRAVRS